MRVLFSCCRRRSKSVLRGRTVTGAGGERLPASTITWPLHRVHESIMISRNHRRTFRLIQIVGNR
jgi:hypothetical protein